MCYFLGMNQRLTRRLMVVVLLALSLGACTTYHQPRYGSDGVYYDQWQTAPRTAVVVDPWLYPYWSLDFFYSSGFYGSYRYGPYRDPFFARGPGFYGGGWYHPHRVWAGPVFWARPVVYKSPPPDQRLLLMQQGRTSTRTDRRIARPGPGSEVQLRHRLAEDRARAETRRDPAAGRGATTRDELRGSDLGPAPRTSRPSSTQRRPAQRPVERTRPERRQPTQTRPVQHRSEAPVRQPAPSTRSQPAPRDRASSRPATRSSQPQRRTPAPARRNPDRRSQEER